MTWKMGNQLATASKTAKGMTFSYDADGIRTSKTVASGNKTVTYSYLTQDGKVMRQEWDEDGVNYQLDFFYDTQGKPLAVIYRAERRRPFLLLFDKPAGGRDKALQACRRQWEHKGQHGRDRDLQLRPLGQSHRHGQHRQPDHKQ